MLQSHIAKEFFYSSDNLENNTDLFS